MSAFERTTTCVALALLLSGCGGNVNLGGKGSAGSGSGSGGTDSASQAPTDPELAPSEPAAKLADDFSLGTLAVADDFLYFSGVNAKEAGELYRCRKDSCDRTRELLTSVGGIIASLQVFDQRLGVTSYDTGLPGGEFWLGSYALPSATDERIAVRGLPGGSAVSPQFLGGFVYFSLGVESGIYRCALPDCPNGPERIGRAERAAPGQIHLCSDGELIFWTDRRLIYRAADYGKEPARALLPDAELSDAPADITRPEFDSIDDVEAMAAGDGFLYAAVNPAETGAQCGASCPRHVMRWPTSGGPSEELFSTEEMVLKLFLLDGELGWLSLSFQPGDPDQLPVLSTCRVEACEATRRKLGRVSARSLVADERDWYWLEAQVVEREAGSASVPELSFRQIRRAPRLPPPG